MDSKTSGRVGTILVDAYNEGIITKDIMDTCLRLNTSSEVGKLLDSYQKLRDTFEKGVITKETYYKYLGEPTNTKYIDKLLELAQKLTENSELFSRIKANPPISLENYNPFYIEYLLNGGKPEDFYEGLAQ